MGNPFLWLLRWDDASALYIIICEEYVRNKYDKDFGILVQMSTIVFVSLRVSAWCCIQVFFIYIYMCLYVWLTLASSFTQRQQQTPDTWDREWRKKKNGSPNMVHCMKNMITMFFFVRFLFFFSNNISLAYEKVCSWAFFDYFVVVASMCLSGRLYQKQQPKCHAYIMQTTSSNKYIVVYPTLTLCVFAVVVCSGLIHKLQYCRRPCCATHGIW